MTLDEVKQLLQDGESQEVELKKSLTQLKPGIETLCAFLNTKGGTIVIGANQYGKIVGQVVTDKTQQEIANEIKKIEPFPDTVNIEYLALTDKKNYNLIIISTAKGGSAPYAYDGRSFYRNQTSTMRMPQSRYSQLLLERGAQSHNSWDTQFVKNATIDDLDHEEIKRTVKIAVNINRMDAEALNEPIEDILMRLELMHDNKLTHAAMVLFAKSVTPNFPQCLIKMARFRGITETGAFIDNQMVHGNAFYIMKAANDFLMTHLPVASFFDESKLERMDKPLLPVLAIREALSNAICHRDYSIHNAAITLAIFDDRMEIWNNGSLPSLLTIDDLRKKHKSYPRNKKMAWVFYLRRYVETWGTGTTKMIELCHSNNIPEPIFEEYSGGLSVTFKFKEKIGSFSEKLNSPLHPRQRRERIIPLLKESGSLSAKEIYTALKVKVSFRTLKTDLLALQQQGRIQQEGKGKNVVWQLVAG
jgi:ATP-dependent DNA helicase RecG